MRYGWAAAAAALAWAAPAAAERWTEVATLPDGAVVSYDADSLARTGDVVRVRVQADLRRAKTGAFAMHDAREELDCRQRTRRRLALVSHGRDGTRTDYGEPQPVAPLAEGTLMAAIFERVCAGS